MALASPDRLAAVFVEAADTLVAEFDLIEFLQRLTSHASEISRTRAAGLLLADTESRLQLMAATDERAEMVELFQVQRVEGPCQDCYREGHPIVNADLAAAADLWPSFAPRAVAAGYRSVHAFPLRLRGTTIGALNLFGDHAGHMEPADAQVVQALADVATIGLLQERTIRAQEVLTAQLQSALQSRIVIEQAKGALAQIHGESPDSAFERMRRYCRSHQFRLGEIALRVTTDPASVPDLTTAG